jgi:hypothetical protein
MKTTTGLEREILLSKESIPEKHGKLNKGAVFGSSTGRGKAEKVYHHLYSQAARTYRNHKELGSSSLPSSSPLRWER